MKYFSLSKALFLILLSLTIALFYSCNKTETEPPVILSEEEYIHYTVNGIAYSYDTPIDKVSKKDSFENQSFMQSNNVFGRRIPNIPDDFTSMFYKKTSIAPGSVQTLERFTSPQTGIYVNYPFYIAGATTSPNPVLVNITEYGLPGEFIAGNFSAVFTGPDPGNIVYNVSCEFRVKR